jgi:hypothetical protein
MLVRHSPDTLERLVTFQHRKENDVNLSKRLDSLSIDRTALFAELRAKDAEWQRRATEVQAQAAHAYARLIELAETSDTGQASRIANFVASTFNGRAFPFDLFELRSLDVAIGDDMLLCLDALRWAKADLYKLVPDGEARVKGVIKAWNLKPALNC